MTTNNPQKNNRIESILKRIEKNELVPKTKSYFRLKFAALILVLVAIIVVTLFLSSFILFSLQVSGHTSLIGFGIAGWQVFFALFPWKLFFLEIVLVILLEYLLRSFKFGYKIPVLYLLAAVTLLVIVSAVAIDLTPLHTSLLNRADHHHLPEPFASLYESTRRPPPDGYGIYRGTVTSIASNTLTMDVDNRLGIGTTSIVEVVVPVGQSTSTIEVGDKVYVKGEKVQGIIEARQIKDVADQLAAPTSTNP